MTTELSREQWQAFAPSLVRRFQMSCTFWRVLLSGSLVALSVACWPVSPTRAQSPMPPLPRLVGRPRLMPAASDNAKAALRRTASGHPALKPLTGLNSVRALRKQLAQIKAKAGHDKDSEDREEHEKSEKREKREKREANNIAKAPERHGKNKQTARREQKAHPKRIFPGGETRLEEDEDETGDWLEARLHYVQMRAYPNDAIDLTALPRALRKRSFMPPARQIGRGPHSGVLKPNILGFGARWQYFGPHNLPVPYRIYYGQHSLIGRINAIVADPSHAGVYYIGAADGGVWKTTDGGQTWAAMSDGWQQIQVSSLALDPTNSQIVYAGTGDYDGYSGVALGIMKSTDGGQTWTNYAQNTFYDVVGAILIDPENPQIVTVTTGKWPYWNGQVYRSTNGGQTFATALEVQAPGSPYTGLEWSGLAIGVKSNGGVRNYYASGQVEGSFVYRSQNQGVTWTNITPPQAAHADPNSYDGNFSDMVRVAASATDPNTVYVLSGYDQAIYKSVDAGTTWSDITNNFPNGPSNNPDYNWAQRGYDLHIECVAGTNAAGAPTDVLYVGLIDLAQSQDGGATWRSIGGPTYDQNSLLHNDQHSLAPNPAVPGELLVGNDGGLFRLTFDASGNPQYASLNAGLGVTQFYHADFAPFDATRVIGGTQDNATPAAVGDLDNWINVGGGDGGGVAINPLKPDVQFATSQFFGIYRTGDNWNSEYYISPNTGNDALPFVTTVSLDPTNPSRFYAGTNYLWRYNDNGAVAPTNPLPWTARLGSQKLCADGGYTVQTIAVAPSDSSTIYTGANDGSVYITKNAGTSWTRINIGLPNRAVTTIVVNPANPNSVLVGFSGSGTGHLWTTNNATAGSVSWKDVSGAGAGALPDISLNGIAFDPDTPQNVWYVGNDVGVFQTLDAGATWQNATAPLGLPNVQVNDIKAVSGTRYLNAATYGRGIWRIRLAPALLSVTTNPVTVVGGTTVTGTVTYSDPVPSGGLTVTLGSNQPAIANPTTPSVTIPAGATTATFTIATKAPINPASVPVTITATANGVTRTTILTVTNTPAVQLTMSATLTRNSNGYQANVTITNKGTLTANNVVLTTAAMRNLRTSAQASGNPLPNVVGTIAGGANKTITFTFPFSIGSSGDQVLLRFAGTYTGGTLTGSTTGVLR